MPKNNYEKEVKELQERLKFEDIADALIADVKATLRDEKKNENSNEKESD
ncbi:hypothetical protein P148_SR1C00001G0004 [candidate division SR1 bacterium RAAC1_SR1_1]|nr:hypothetical protein P148_SR1C00001G0004 [candidate division SR1 bacterium RAAC1_SR1_1]